MFRNLQKRTKILLWILLGIIIVAAGVLTYGQLTGKLKTGADVTFPYGTGTISGVVTDKNNVPQEGLFVSINTKDPAGGYVPIDKTTATGHYAFIGLKEGASYGVEARKDSCYGASGEFTATNTSANLMLKPFFAGQITGHVQELNTNIPISDAFLVFQVGDHAATAVTDPNGYYVIPTAYLSAGTGSVEVSATGYEDLQSTITLPACANKIMDFKLKKATGTITGTVKVNGIIPKGWSSMGIGVNFLNPVNNRSKININDGSYSLTAPIGGYEVKICFSGGGGGCLTSTTQTVIVNKNETTYLDLEFKF